MMNWYIEGRVFAKGCVMDASLDIQTIDSLSIYFTSVWKKSIEVLLMSILDKGHEFGILIEIWMDSGRVITIISSSAQELARLVLAIPFIEESYYNIPIDYFDSLYQMLLKNITNALVKSKGSREYLELCEFGIKHNCQIIIRDSDDKMSELDFVTLEPYRTKHANQ
ncbi:MAG: hypothetical protein SFY80_15610 [Verrucomicrobiota bacterium]|nr:hypothetical protein [Verrucomicrobiota bacterium]